MRWLRFALPVLSLGFVASSPALSLQWLSKWNPSQPVATSFYRISAYSGGYLIAARTGLDVMLVRTDFSGNVLQTTAWDSPSAGQDEPLDLQVDDSGFAYLLVGTRVSGPISQLHLAGYSFGTLNKAWERTYLPVSSSFSSATMAVRAPGASVAYLAFSSGIGGSNRITTVGVNASGTPLFSTDIDNGNDNVANCAVANPTAAVGVYIGGGTGDREAVYHVSEGGSVMWNVFGAAPNVNGNQIQKIALEGSTITAIGRFRSALANPYQASAFAVTSGALTRYTYAGATDGTDLVNTSAGQWSILMRKSGGYEIQNFDRGTGIFSLKINNTTNAFPTFLRRAGAYGVANGGGGLQSYNLTTNTSATSGVTGLSWNDGVAESGSYVTAVGSNSSVGRGVLTLIGSGISGTTGYGFGGYVNRTPLESVDDASGAKYVLSQTDDNLGNIACWVTKYTAAGAVAWIRQVVVSGETRINARAIDWSQSDSTVVVIGSKSNGDIAATKLNSSTGAVIWAKQVVIYGATHSIADAKVEPSGTIWILTNGQVLGDDKEGLVRLGTTGNRLSYGYWNPMLLFSAALQLYRVNNNLWAATILGSGATFEAASVRFYDASSAYLGSYTFDASTSLPSGNYSAQAPDGDVICAVPRSNGDLEVRRFETSAGSVWSTTIADRASTNIAVAGAADGTTYVAGFRTGGPEYRLDQLSATGSSNWSVVLVNTVNSVRDLATDSNSWAYFMGTEGTAPRNTYIARYLTTGVRSAQQRIAGEPTEISTRSGFGVWALGRVTSRNRAQQVSLARYNSP